MLGRRGAILGCNSVSLSIVNHLEERTAEPWFPDESL